MPLDAGPQVRLAGLILRVIVSTDLKQGICQVACPDSGRTERSPGLARRAAGAVAVTTSADDAVWKTRITGRVLRMCGLRR